MKEGTSMKWIDALTSQIGKSNSPQLPDSFIFGVATSDHQCEAYDPIFMDIRDVWERVRHPEAMRRNATDFWNRYNEDIEIAKKLGCKAFRFSIAWSRVEPEPGMFNQAALNHYDDLIEKIISCRMQPVLTLHHFTWPVHVEQRGGMISEDFPDMFADYVTRVAEHFGRKVPYWITFNEPNLLVSGYFKPWWDTYYNAPPGLPAGTTPFEEVEAVGNLIRNLFLAHKKAYEIIKAKNPNAKVGVNQYCYGLPRWLQKLVNRKASSIKGNKDLQRQMDKLAERRDLIRGNRISKLRANFFEKDRVDVVIAALTQTPEREKQVVFSEPYFVAGQQLMVKITSNARSKEDLFGKVIATVKGSTSEKNLYSFLLEAKPLVVSDYEKALNALIHGQAEALLTDNTIIYGLMAQNPGQYRIIEDLLTDDDCYAAAVAKGDRGLLNVLDSVVLEFKKSAEARKWNAIYEQFTGLKIQAPPRTVRALTISKPSLKSDEMQRMATIGPMPKAPLGTTLRRIQDRGYVVVAIRHDLPGFGLRDPITNNPVGLEIDLARSIATRIFGDDKHVRFQAAEIGTRMELLRTPLSFLDSIIKPFSILSTMLATDWWYLGMAKRLDEFLCPEECTGKLDFVGLDYYWGISTLRMDRILRLIDAAYRRFDRAPVSPGALYGILKDFQDMFPEKSLFIFENGSVEVADNIDRATYIRKHVDEVKRAVRDNVNVDGYICWALTSNREWDCEFSAGSDFGLIHIDLDSDPFLIRGPFTPSAISYMQIIRDRAP
jgi:beta-glucosidase/6-phospho-beta-glucosidase/beta-galactosidase/ABC-type amino acid transport substrate-binding protein